MLKSNSSTQNLKIANKKKYKQPRLERLGDVRDVTMGSSPGIGESTMAGVRKRATP